MDKKEPEKRLMDPGCAVITQAFIRLKSTNVKITNPEKLLHDMPPGCYGRVHSRKSATTLVVWVCDEATFNAAIVEVPESMMGVLFKVHRHNMYKHFA